MANTPSYICGFEMGSPHEAAVVGSTPLIQTTTVRSGAYAFRQDTTAGQMTFQSKAAGATLRSIMQSARLSLRIDTMPSGGYVLYDTVDATSTMISRILLNTDGTFTVRSTVADTATSTNALTADAQWHLIEFDLGWNAGAGARIYVDGVSWASVSTGAVSAQPSARIGSGVTAVSRNLFVDDLMIFSDDLGGVNWPDWKVPLLRPISDNSRGNWTGGAGGTTNLWEALNNQPPVGLTAGSDSDTSQIQNATSATYPATAAQLGQFNCETYTTAGIQAGDTIRAVQAIANHGEGIATGTKPGGVFIVSNPAQGTLGDWFDYGDDIGAIGTFPFTTAGTPTRGWFTAAATPVANPAVALGTSAVIGIFKNVASTREGHVDFAGLYVAYTPVVATKAPPPYRRSLRVWNRRRVA